MKKHVGLALDGDEWSAAIPRGMAPRLDSTVGVDAVQIRKI